MLVSIFRFQLKADSPPPPPTQIALACPAANNASLKWRAERGRVQTWQWSFGVRAGGGGCTSVLIF